MYICVRARVRVCVYIYIMYACNTLVSIYVFLSLGNTKAFPSVLLYALMMQCLMSKFLSSCYAVYCVRNVVQARIMLSCC